ncbi:hypothetical protein [Amycolatopsis panacis]|uniref:hypothetical protein n=1 Tax=Amycolatopsis panacis TaxID=2340917 RepID=UPI001F1935C1|nr:hypothetical protein [Amycolatopsis panacis]
MAKNRAPTFPAADAQFFAGVRRGVLAMWLCAVVTVVLGVLILVVIADGRGGTPVSAGALTAAFAVAVVAVIFAAATSILVRRAVPKA